MDTDKTPPGMRQALVKLHLSIVLAGFTGILGKLITISEGMLVWYRILLTLVLFCSFKGLRGELRWSRVRARDFFRIGGVGVLLCLHWLFFYGSIKASNVSVGVVCFALVGVFTAYLEPLFMRSKISRREVFLSLFSLIGIILIFSFDARYRTGIALGVISSLFAALFTVANKKACAAHSSGAMLLYEMAGGLLFLSCVLPLYIKFFNITYLFPTARDWFGLFLLSFFCTIIMLILQVQALKFVSAFTVNLSFNLEPVYTIAIAILFLGEGKELGASFYAGMGIILLSAALQCWVVLRQRGVVLSPRSQS